MLPDKVRTTAALQRRGRAAKDAVRGERESGGELRAAKPGKFRQPAALKLGASYKDESGRTNALRAGCAKAAGSELYTTVPRIQFIIACIA